MGNWEGRGFQKDWYMTANLSGVRTGCEWRLPDYKQEVIKEYHLYGKRISGYQEEERNKERGCQSLGGSINYFRKMVCQSQQLEGISSWFDLSIIQGNWEIKWSEVRIGIYRRAYLLEINWKDNKMKGCHKV